MSGARVLRVDPSAAAGAAFDEASRVLGRGGIVAHPTETLYGLAVDPWNETALGRLDRLKRRPAGSGYILIAASREQALLLASRPWPRHLDPLAEAFWPGALTLVLPPSAAAPEAACRGRSGIALRVTSDPIASKLVAAFGRPLTSTSANRGGDPPARTAAEVVEAMGEEIDLVLDGGARDGGQPSTIIDLTGEEPAIVRAGALAEAKIRAVLCSARGGGWG